MAFVASLFVFGFLSFLIFGFLTVIYESLPFCVVGLVIVLMISSTCAWLVFYDRNHEGRKEAFAITTLRVLHYYHSCWGWEQNIDDLYLEQVIDIDMSKSGYVTKKYNVGNIYFATRGGSRSSSGGATSVKFEFISDPKTKHEEFRDLIIEQLEGGELRYSIDKLERKVKVGAAPHTGGDEAREELREIKEILKRIEKKL